MRHLSRLINIEPQTTKGEVLKGLKRPHEDDTLPVQMSFPSDADTSYKFVVEFDHQGRAAFGELTASIKGENTALAEFRRVAAELSRTEVIKPDPVFRPPIRRTTLAMNHLLAWSSWPMGDSRRLQLLVGIFHSAKVNSCRTQLAASVHIDGDVPGYGPKPGDISTTQAKGWADYDRLIRPDVNGGFILIRDAQFTVPIRTEPEPNSPGSVFRIFETRPSSSFP